MDSYQGTGRGKTLDRIDGHTLRAAVAIVCAFIPGRPDINAEQ